MNIEEILIEDFGVTKEDLQRSISYQHKYGGKLENILVNMGSLSNDQLPLLYQKLFDIPLLDITAWIESEAIEAPREELLFLLDKKWVPLDVKEGVWTFACCFPLELEINEWLANKSIEFKLFLINDEEFSILRSKYDSLDQVSHELNALDEEDKLKEMAGEAPTVNLMNSLITRALRSGASDMHLEPIDNRYRVRFRIDGVLQEIESISTSLHLPLITRLKILSGMDIAEKRRPQDGKIEMKIANQDIDIRVSALPLNEGESVVMRFLKKESVRYDIGVLGLSRDIRTLIEEDLSSTAGVVLLTGPTGSGKTTTLYTFLNELNGADNKIITLEDPVEYQMQGINQVQVNSEIGFNFAAGLRSIVRQDPDIIMLGEIRDGETAQIALQSALTGHLVFSTVHTNDAASAFTRLLDLGIEEFLLNAALVSIVAQRLARKICPACKQLHPDSDSITSKYKLDVLSAKFGIDFQGVFHGVGCEHCAHTGFKGRLAITEYLRCDEHIKSLPKDANFISNAQKYNASLNRRSLLEDGLYKVASGQTTIEEVVRVAG